MSLSIHFTLPAIEHLKQWRQKEPTQVIRFYLKAAGCSGWRYQFEFAPQPHETDVMEQIAEDLILYIDKKSIPLMENTTIDYIRVGLNGQFKFINPKEEGSCGCGESVFFKALRTPQISQKAGETC